jgi:hypothetical protein
MGFLHSRHATAPTTNTADTAMRMTSCVPHLFSRFGQLIGQPLRLDLHRRGRTEHALQFAVIRLNNHDQTGRGRLQAPRPSLRIIGYLAKGFGRLDRVDPRHGR